MRVGKVMRDSGSRNPEPRVNLILNPRFRRAAGPDSPEAAEYYVHVNNTAERSDEWNADDSGGSLRVVGTTASFDTHFSPEGRDGAFRTGLVAGRTYRSRATVYLPKRLTGPLAKTRLSISPGWTVAGVHHWNPLPSPSADNSPGVHVIEHTFTVPADASGAWLRFVSGMASGGGAVFWDQLQLTGENGGFDFFDGATPDDDFHTHSWAGEPDASASMRLLREPSDIVRRHNGLPALAAALARQLRNGADDEVALVELWVGRNRRDDREFAHFQGAMYASRGDRKGAWVRLNDALRTSAYTDAVHLELGKLAQADSRTNVADSHYARAVGGGGLFEAGYRRAALYDKKGDLEASRRESIRASSTDPELPFDIEAALAIDPKGIRVRRELGIFVRANLDEIRSRALDPVRTDSTLTGTQPVFTYWQQGFGSAPAIVKRCHESVIAHTDPNRLHVLDGTNLAHYAELPTATLRAVGDNFTHLSDLIRLDLLARYGGFWIDATCLLTGSITRSEPALVSQGFFAFNYSGPRVGSWFMAAKPGDHAVLMLREAMLLWWEREGRLSDYFQLHYMLEMLYWFDPQFTAAWNTAQHRHPRAALAMQAALHQPNSNGLLQRLASAYWVHKLTYKNDVGRAGVNSVAAAIVRGEVAAGAFVDRS